MGIGRMPKIHKAWQVNFGVNDSYNIINYGRKIVYYW